MHCWYCFDFDYKVEDITKRERTAKRHAATTQSFLNYKFIVTILALDTNTYNKSHKRVTPKTSFIVG